jgi:hypothetical protein
VEIAYDVGDTRDETKLPAAVGAGEPAAGTQTADGSFLEEILGSMRQSPGGGPSLAEDSDVVRQPTQLELERIRARTGERERRERDESERRQRLAREDEDRQLQEEQRQRIERELSMVALGAQLVAAGRLDEAERLLSSLSPADNSPDLQQLRARLSAAREIRREGQRRQERTDRLPTDARERAAEMEMPRVPAARSGGDVAPASPRQFGPSWRVLGSVAAAFLVAVLVGPAIYLNWPTAPQLAPAPGAVPGGSVTVAPTRPFDPDAAPTPTPPAPAPRPADTVANPPAPPDAATPGGTTSTRPGGSAGSSSPTPAPPPRESRPTRPRPSPLPPAISRPAVGTLIVTIRDPQGSAAPGLRVDLVDLRTGETVTSSVTSGEGQASFAELRPGDYEAVVSEDAEVTRGEPGPAEDPNGRPTLRPIVSRIRVRGPETRAEILLPISRGR